MIGQLGAAEYLARGGGDAGTDLVLSLYIRFLGFYGANLWTKLYKLVDSGLTENERDRNL